MSTDAPPPRRPRQAPLPDSLKTQLSGFRSQLWKVKVAEAVLAGIFGLLFSYLLVFGLDRIWATPGTVRLSILIGGTSLFVFFAPYWIHRWVFGHRNESQLARLIADRFPRLGDRLLGVVELQDQKESAESLSPELRAAAMVNVANEAKGRDFEKALPASRHRSWSLGVLATFILAIGALVVVPKAGVNALKRWLMPLSDTPRYTFTRLLDIPQRIVVPKGEPFDVVFNLDEDSDRKPATGSAQYDQQDPVFATLGENNSDIVGTDVTDHENAYTFTFPGQQAQGIIRINIGDVQESIRVEPVLRPATEAIAALVTYPDYIQQDPRRIDLRAGVLSVLEGSQVSVEATVSRELDSAEMDFRPLNQDRVPDPDEPGDILQPETVTLETKGRNLTSPPRQISNVPAKISLTWTDVLGLEPAKPFELRVEPVPDQAPTTYIQGVDRQRVMLVEETIEFEVLSEDDYGVKEIGIEWSGQFTKPTDETPANGDMKVLDGAPDAQRLGEAVAFSPSVLGIQPQKLTLRAYAEDYAPGRGRIYSEPITLFILTRDEHAQLLKTQFDRIIGELEDLARREQNNHDENKRLERVDPENLQGDEAQEKLKTQEQNEAENTDRMKELSEKMEELFKDAARNGELDPETMQKLAESLKKMQELGNKDMPKVEKKLSDTQDQRSTPEQSKDDLEKAVEEQKKVLEKMRETIEQANEANRDFEASTFINRLKRAATEEDGIAASLYDHIADLIGLDVEGVDPSDQRLLGELATQQRRTASDVRWIQEDLGHFYARTQKEIHKELLLEMQESQIDSALDDNRRRIAENQTYKSISHSRNWAEILREWAKKLEEDGSDDGGGGGGGGGGGSPEDQDFEFMLKVMQMIQKEQDIRSRTRALEQLRRSLQPQNENPAKP